MSRRLRGKSASTMPAMSAMRARSRQDQHRHACHDEHPAHDIEPDGGLAVLAREEVLRQSRHHDGHHQNPGNEQHDGKSAAHHQSRMLLQPFEH